MIVEKILIFMKICKLMRENVLIYYMASLVSRVLDNCKIV